MPAYLAWLAWSVVLSAPQSPAELKSPGWSQWQQGQRALQDGDSVRAINHFEESLAADPKLTRNYLSLAAAWLDRNDDGKACLYLALYVAAHPDHAAVRFQYVEMLRRLRRDGQARQELEAFIADVQQAEQPAEDQLIHCHSRLMQMAEEDDNVYEAHLHRGIGLYLLSRQRDIPGDDPDLLCAEGLLCKAATELTQATSVRPSEARPHFYLHEVWSSLGQSHPAVRSLHAASAASGFSYLTVSEQRRLRQSTMQQIRDSRPAR